MAIRNIRELGEECLRKVKPYGFEIVVADTGKVS